MRILLFFSLFSLYMGQVQAKSEGITVTEITTVTVSSPVDRKAASIEVPLEKLFPKAQNITTLTVIDKHRKPLLTQLIDTDEDGQYDLLLFQYDLVSQKEYSFAIYSQTNNNNNTGTNALSYAKFVPERIDDFAWENDKVAFRTYGPQAKQMLEAGDRTGTVSSGVDCWLKRVNYPIIDKWYRGNAKGKSYHVDRGEGLDNFHVGISRGCGGTAVVDHGNFYPSPNFAQWRIIANGPIRTIFELKHFTFMFPGNIVTETRRISLDLGSNLYRCEVSYEGAKEVKQAAIGLSLHQNKGTTHAQDNWITYWEPIDDSEIGMAVILTQGEFAEVKKVEDGPNDNKHLWLIAHTENTENKKQKIAYYSGFGWKKSQQFHEQAAWITYVKSFAQSLQNPLKIEIK